MLGFYRGFININYNAFDRQKEEKYCLPFSIIITLFRCYAIIHIIILLKNINKPKI